MSPAELQKRLQAVEPAAVLVAPAVIDKIIRQTLKLPAWMWTVPHRRCWNVERQFLFRYVEQEDLLVRHDQLLPATLLLLEKPAGFEQESDAALLRVYWRLLFHASVDLELTNQAVAGRWPAPIIGERINGLGAAVFEEIREVLEEEHQWIAGAERRTVYLEFVAVFLEMYYFARSLLESYFPGIVDIERVKEMVCADIDGDGLFQRTRLPGAADPNLKVESGPDQAHEFFYELIAASDAANSEGNLVRAAILRSQAARVAPAAQAKATRRQAVGLLELLVKRLQPALEISAAEFPQWSQHLPELLDKADQGSRPSEAYLLYDLQKVCLDFEQEIYTLDLVEWALSAGKKPVQRPLSSQRFVPRDPPRPQCGAAFDVGAPVRSRSQAFRRFARCGAGALREPSPRALSSYHHRRPGRRGPVPRDAFERTAFFKLTEELLDRVLVYGFLTFSDLRDALARNRLKLPDLSDPQDFIRGDPLLRLDRRLATLLDGVYRRGEVYLRVLERFTALNFGTGLGRLITRYVTIPFGGAFLILQGVSHFLLHPLGVEEVPAFLSVSLWVALAFFLLALVHSAAVRRWCVERGQALWRPVKGLFVELPLWLVRNTLLTEVLSSWTFQLLYWYVLKPLVLCLLLGLVWPELFSAPAGSLGDAQVWVQAALVFMAANFLINSRPGKAATEALNHVLRAPVGNATERPGSGPDSPGGATVQAYFAHDGSGAVRGGRIPTLPPRRQPAGDAGPRHSRRHLVSHLLFGPLQHGGARRAGRKPREVSRVQHCRQSHLSAVDRGSALALGNVHSLLRCHRHLCDDYLVPVLAAGRVRLFVLRNEGELEPLSG